MELIDIIHNVEEIGKTLFCEKVEIGNAIRYQDDMLVDMYDHNYYYASYVDEEIYNKCLKYSLSKKDKHIKFILKNEFNYLNTIGFETGIEITMYKEDSDYGDKLYNNITFKSLKEMDFSNELLEMEIRNYGSIYGHDFCLRKSNRLFDVARKSNAPLDYIGAFIEGRFVGSCSILVGEVIGVDDLIVEKEYRHQGIGTSILRYVRKNYNRPIYLHADIDDTPKDMYLSLGFKIVDKTYSYLKYIK